MHELLAPIVYVLELDKRPRTCTSTEFADQDSPETFCSPPHTICHLLDADFCEADAWLLFRSLMEIMADAFKTSQKRQAGPHDISNVRADVLVLTHQALPIIQSCHRMQNVILRGKDFELFTHLNKVEIEPQLYSLFPPPSPSPSRRQGVGCGFSFRASSTSTTSSSSGTPSSQTATPLTGPPSSSPNTSVSRWSFSFGRNVRRYPPLSRF
jgi:hypothetical protein